MNTLSAALTSSPGLMRLQAVAAQDAAQVQAPSPVVPPEPADPRDVVVTQRAAPVPAAVAVTAPSNPWPGIEALGLLAAGAILPGPLGATLGAGLSDGLRQVAVRLEKSGVEFEKKLGWLDSAVAGIGHQPLTADEFADALLAGDLDGKLEVSAPHEPRRPLRSLGDLQTLDALHGLGMAAAGSQAGGLGALQSLVGLGWRFSSSSLSGETGTSLSLVDAWASLHSHQSVGAYTPGDAPQFCGWIARGDDMMLLDFLKGSGVDRGISDPVMVSALRDLEQHGYQFGQVSDRPYLKDAFKFYHEDTSAELRVGSPAPGSVQVIATRDELRDAPGLVTRIQQAQRLYDTYARSSMEASGTEDYPNRFTDQILEPDFCPGLTPDVRAELVGAVLPSHRGATCGRIDAAVNDVRQMARRIHAEDGLRKEVHWYGEVLAHLRGETSGDDLRRVRDCLCHEAGDEQEYAWMQSSLLQLLQGLGSLGTALEALDYLRFVTGPETRDERMAALLDLARTKGRGEEGRALQDFRILLGRRFAGESLTDGLQRYRNLLQSNVPGLEERALEFLLAAIRQGGTEGGGPARTDEVISRAMKSLVFNPSLDDAMEAMKNPVPPAQQANGDVRRESDGTLVVGGVRVPTRTA